VRRDALAGEREIAALEADVEALEERWFELTEALG